MLIGILVLIGWFVQNDVFKLAPASQNLSLYISLGLIILSVVLLLLFFITGALSAVLKNTQYPQLKKSEKNFELLVNSVKDYAIFMLDVQGNVASWNSGARHIKGYTAEEIIGQPIDVFYTAAALQQNEPKSNLQMALQLGHYEAEGWRVRKDGTSFWANVVFTPLYDERDLLYGYAKVTRDITEKMKAGEQLQFLATIADNIQDPVISTDNDSKITRWNKAAELLLEWKMEEVIGKNGEGILKVDYLEEKKEIILASLQQKNYWQGEVIYHKKSGGPVNVLITTSQIKNPHGHITGHLTVVRDITERKKDEEKLKEFKYFFNNSNDLSYIANTEGYFQIVNPCLNDLLGYSQNELLEKLFLDFVHPDDVAATLKEYDNLKAGATVIHYSNRYRKKDGSYLLLEWNATSNAATGKWYCIARDITERQKAEDELRTLNEELEAFSYSISHDLRAPLRGIIGFTNILEEDYSSKLDDEARRITGVIKNNSLKLGNLIDDLLAFSRLGRQQIVKTAVNTNELINEIIAGMDFKTGSKDINWIIAPLPLVQADINTIRQVWINLISNAVNYTQKQQHPVIEIGTLNAENEIVFFIKDNGVGFDNRYKDKLFKVFQRLHSAAEFDGTGVGLAIVEKIITRHAGKVWAEASIDKGACFYISFPIHFNKIV